MPTGTLNDLFFRAAEGYDKPDAFLVKKAGGYQPVSHRDVLAAVEELSLGLISMGLNPGDRVALLSENRLEWALADYAILTAGLVNVPIYVTLPAPQVEFILRDSGARVVLVSNETHRRKIEALGDRLNPAPRLVCFEEGSFEELRREGRMLREKEPHLHRARAGAVREDDLASIVYTSGTTGNPKGVMLTHANFCSNVAGALDVLPLGPADRCLSFLPLCHVFERMAGHFTMFHCGVTIAYAESFDSVSRNLLEVGPTVLISVPRLYEKMHARVMENVARSSALRRRLFQWAVDVGRRRSLLVLDGRRVPPLLSFQYGLAGRLVFARLRARTGGRIRFMVSGGAPLHPELALFFHAAGLPILEGYGLTETSPVISCNRMNAMKIGSVGQPIPGVVVQVAGDGEILVQGPGVMKGYLNRPDATGDALKGGWFHTGDIGRLDEDGFLQITDRKKDLIVTAGGKNVAPQPIENRLKADPMVAEAALIGDRQPYVVALIVPDFEKLTAWAGENGIRGDIATLCRDGRVLEFMTARVMAINRELAPFEQIKRVGLIDRELTVERGDLTPSLKVKRRVLAETFRDLIESLYVTSPREGV